MFPVWLIAASLALAPMQCRGSEEPATLRSESPADAIYDLAHRFRDEGNEQAYRKALRYLVKRYPSSRRATMAKEELGIGANAELETEPETQPQTQPEGETDK